MLCRVSKGARQALTAAKPAAVVTGRVGERIAGVGERLRGMMSWCTITVLDLSWFHLMHECESLAGVLRQCSSWLAHLDPVGNEIAEGRRAVASAAMAGSGAPVAR